MYKSYEIEFCIVCSAFGPPSKAHNHCVSDLLRLMEELPIAELVLISTSSSFFRTVVTRIMLRRLGLTHLISGISRSAGSAMARYNAIDRDFALEKIEAD